MYNRLVALIDILRMNHDSSSNLSERTPVGATAYIHSGILQVKVINFFNRFTLKEEDFLLCNIDENFEDIFFEIVLFIFN